jgi:hypothetical protein
MKTLQYTKHFKKNRFINKNYVNYSLYDLTDDAYTIDYDVTLSNGTQLQRPFVWTLEQKQKLVLTVLKQMHIPAFHVLIEKPYSNGKQASTRILHIIDGKQRLSALMSFINNEYPIIVDNEEYYFKDFDSIAKYTFMSTSLDFNVVYKYNYPGAEIITDNDLIDWFCLVNFAGTKQDEEHFAMLTKLKNS